MSKWAKVILNDMQAKRMMNNLIIGGIAEAENGIKENDDNTFRRFTLDVIEIPE